jgi:hypothetical protein
MALIKITSEIEQTENFGYQMAYEIPQDEGSAIIGITPPQCLRNVDFQSFTPEQEFKLKKLTEHWKIVSYWLVFHRAVSVNVKLYPFTEPPFLDVRLLADLYNLQLELCKQVWLVIPIEHIYPSPLDWWQACIRECQESQLKDVLKKRDCSKTGMPKGKLESGLRKFKNDLKDGLIPEELPKESHLYILYQQALKLRKSNKNVSRAWNDYLDAMNDYCRAIKRNKEIKTLITWGGKLYWNDRSKLISVQLE